MHRMCEDKPSLYTDFTAHLGGGGVTAQIGRQVQKCSSRPLSLLAGDTPNHLDVFHVVQRRCPSIMMVATALSCPAAASHVCELVELEFVMKICGVLKQRE